MTCRTRTIFILSDRTGITVDNLSHSLLTQFDDIDFERLRYPYLDTMEKVCEVVDRINQCADREQCKPLVFSSIVDPELRDCVGGSRGVLIDFFDAFIGPLEEELGQRSVKAIGRAHGMGNQNIYKGRIDAINYSMANDDGITTRNYPEARIVLIGVSRSGKTPTCLYLALHYGIHAANYPITEEDLGDMQLPAPLKPYQEKLFGLTIDPERLQRIREERRPDSRYASLEQCRMEVKAVKSIFERENIPFVDTSTMSIEEIATTVMHRTGIKS